MGGDFGIAGKTAFVTGSGRNIGRAILLELASRGANVIVNARSDEAEADAVAKEVEGEALCPRADGLPVLLARVITRRSSSSSLVFSCPRRRAA